MTSHLHVAVLGAGRMGSAIALRLTETLSVRAWSRSAPEAFGVPIAQSLPEALDRADVVVLALYDGAACREVLDLALPHMAAGAHVVNVATVSASEAAELEQLVVKSGRSYLHAPVLGSVPAVLSGTLTVLLGGPPSAEVRTVLDRLGGLLTYDSVHEAARSKLLAAAVLADSLVLLRHSLHRAQAMGLSRSAALELLRHTAIGGLVTGKHDRLQAGATNHDRAEFTLGALRKDMLLLQCESGERSRFLDVTDHLVQDTGVPEAADIAAAAVVHDDRRTVPEANLQVAPSVDVAREVLAPLVAYAMGHATGDPSHFRRAFLPTAHIEGLREGGFRSWDLEAYVTFFDGPAEDEAARRRVVDRVDRRGSVATATMTLDHGSDRFIDKFILIEGGDGWRIANKVFERLEQPAP